MHFAELRRRLGARVVVVRIGEAPPISVCVEGAPPWVGSQANGTVSLALSEQDLRELLRGELALEDGVLSDRINLKGGVDHLLAFFDAVIAWLHGALRSPSLPLLQDRYLARPAGASDVTAAPRGARSC